MKVAPLANPESYQDLYVFDFGEWTAVGYTAAEIAVLLEDPRYREGAVYRIHGARPDGTMELVGVSRDRFELEGGMFFYRRELADARVDFDELVAVAERDVFPARAYVHLADRGREGGDYRFVTALIYPSEFDVSISRWLLDHDFKGGDTVEGGISGVANYLEESRRIIDRRQFRGQERVASRTAEEVLATVRRAVQR